MYPGRSPLYHLHHRLPRNHCELNNPRDLLVAVGAALLVLASFPPVPGLLCFSPCTGATVFCPVPRLFFCPTTQLFFPPVPGLLCFALYPGYFPPVPGLLCFPPVPGLLCFALYPGYFPLYRGYCVLPCTPAIFLSHDATLVRFRRIDRHEM
jgi:hypothetical protein